MSNPTDKLTALSAHRDNLQSGGFVLLYASLIDHPVIGFSKPYDWGQAFIWLLVNACRKPSGRQRTFKNKAGKVTVVEEDYGQYAGSIDFFATAWGWTPMQVRGFFKKLEKPCEMITKDATKQVTKITICNFWNYQNPKQANEQLSNLLTTNDQRTVNDNDNTLQRNTDNTLTAPPQVKPPEMPAVQWYMWEHYKIAFDRGAGFVSEYGERHCWQQIDFVEFHARNKSTGIKIHDVKASVIDSITKPWKEPKGYVRTILPESFGKSDTPNILPSASPSADLEEEDGIDYDSLYKGLPESKRIEVNRQARRRLQAENNFAWKQFEEQEKEGLPPAKMSIIPRSAYIGIRNQILITGEF